MSETSNSINTPPAEDFNTTALQGSMQQVLADNIGKYVTVEFLIGTDLLQTKTGYIYDVGIGYLALYDDLTTNYIVCDVFAIKFVTFIAPVNRPNPGQTLQQAIEEGNKSGTTSGATSSGTTGAANGQTTTSNRANAQAAFNYAKRKARR